LSPGNPFSIIRFRGDWIAAADDINFWEREGMGLALIELFDYLNLPD